MAIVRRCDRCNTIYDRNSVCYRGHPVSVIYLMRQEHSTVPAMSWDMCDDCMRKLIQFMDEMADIGEE